MIVAATYGLARYCYGLFIPSFEREFGVSIDVLGLIASGSYLSYMLATLFGSWVSSLVGPRFPIVLGGMFATAGILLIAAAETPWALAIGVMVAGTSPGLAYPPLSDTVMRLVPTKQQNRTYTTVNSGTSIGVILAGPLALWAGEEWRWAWLGFAVFALIATAWNYRIMPTGRHGGPQAALPRLKWRWFVKRQSYKLHCLAMLLGLATSVYWTFAVDFIVTAGQRADAGPSTFLALFSPEARSQVFWIIIGVSGLVGAVAGDLVTAFGLRAALRGTAVCIAGAIFLLMAAPTDAGAIFASAALFGSTFILATGLVGVWSVHVFHDRPSAGFGLVFMLITFGQLIGPAVSGFAVEHHGFTPVFLGAGLLCGLMAFLAPRRDIRSMAQSLEPA